MSPPRVAKVNPPFALTLYRLVAWLLGRLLTAKWRRRGRVEPRYLHDIPARFGHYQHPSGVGYIWIHAVSLGETRACVPLLDAVRAQWPGQPLLLTHGTATGWEAGTSLLRPGDLQTWLPWDEPAAVKRFLTHHQPRLGILMETEVWPELTTQCDALQVPLFLVNARLSDRSLRKALRLSSLAKWVFSRLAGVVPQTAADAQRIQRLDAPVLASSGNIKFDVSINNIQLEKGREWRTSLNKPVLMLASSREGEEAALISALKDPVHDAYFDVGAYHWLVVPRHPNRVEAVVALFTAAGFTVRRRSVWGADVPDAPEAVDSKVIWLGDTLGEMPLYYGLADVALLGGSFGEWGGQNIIEAAACGCPVVFGPHTYNFAQATDSALAAGAAVRVADLSEAVSVAAAIAVDAPLRAQMADAGTQMVRENQGAAQRTIAALKDALG
jgi:3-deoxy-D-manno-octulosonic-acid transferase